MRSKLQIVEEELDRQLEIDREARKEIEELLQTEISLEGANVRVRMKLHAWLTLVTKAHAVGWRPGDGVGILDCLIPAEDARLLAVALSRVDLGPKWRQLIMAVLIVGLSGEFRVNEASGDAAAVRAAAN